MTRLHDSLQDVALWFYHTHLTNHIAGVVQNDREIVAVWINVKGAAQYQITHQRQETLYRNAVAAWIEPVCCDSGSFVSVAALSDDNSFYAQLFGNFVLFECYLFGLQVIIE